MYWKQENMFALIFLMVSFLISPIRSMPARRDISIQRDAAVTFSITGANAAYPRATNLANGQLLGVYTEFRDNIQTITFVASDNNGASWVHRGSAAQKPVSGGTLDNGFVLQLSTGRVLAAFRNHDIDGAGRFTTYRITICSSDDNGASWVFLSDAVVVPATATLNGVWEPYLRNAADGSLQLYYSHERSAADQDSVMISSHDGGKTWGNERSVSGLSEGSSRDGMIGVAELGGTNLLAVFETKVGDGTFFLCSVSSSDDGATWSNRQNLYVPPAGKNAGAPQIAKIGNNLVTSFMTDEDNSLGSAASWIDVADAKLLVSQDNGATWTRSTVFEEPSLWPGITALRDQKSFLFLVGNNGLKSQRFIF